MAKPVKKKSAYERYMNKHSFISLFVTIQACMMIAFIFEIVLFKTFGYSQDTQYYPLSNQKHTLPFWKKCGTHRPADGIPFSNLFCANDTNTYVNPFLRAVLFGIEAYAVMLGFLIGIILLVVGIVAVRDRRKKNNIDASARQKLKQMAVLFVFLIAILVVIYHFA